MTYTPEPTRTSTRPSSSSAMMASRMVGARHREGLRQLALRGRTLADFVFATRDAGRQLLSDALVQSLCVCRHFRRRGRPVVLDRAIIAGLTNCPSRHHGKFSSMAGSRSCLFGSGHGQILPDACNWSGQLLLSAATDDIWSPAQGVQKMNKFAVRAGAVACVLFGVPPVQSSNKSRVGAPARRGGRHGAERVENVQDVPLAVSVVSEGQMESAGVREFADMAKVAPSLNIRAADQPVNASVALRGIGTFAFGIGVGPASPCNSTMCRSRSRRVHSPISPMWSASKCCAVHRARCMGRARRLRFDQHHHARAHRRVHVDHQPAGHDRRRISWRAECVGTDRLALDLSPHRQSQRFQRQRRQHATGKTVNGRDDTTLRGKLKWDATDALTVTLGLNYSDGEATAVSPLSRMSTGGAPARQSGARVPIDHAGHRPERGPLRIRHDVEPLARVQTASVSAHK